MREREVFRICFWTGQEYHLAVNRFPVTTSHFVVIRPATSPEELLTQSILSASEVEEMARFLCLLGPPYRIYYNSNRGRDGSSSGSSINHWHFQVLAYPHGQTPAEEQAGEPVVAFRPAESGCKVGELRSWPAPAYVFEGADLEALAEIVWRTLERVIAADRAYNLEAVTVGERVRVYLFPKSPGTTHEIPEVGELRADFGGIEMGGDIVLACPRLLRWFVENAEAGERLTTSRLAEATSLLGD